MTDKAQRAIVTIGNLEVEGFMMPDGSYRMSQTQAAVVVGKDESNARKFLRSRGVRTLLGENYTPGKKASVEVDSEDQATGQTRFTPLTLDEVTAFWMWEAYRGNKTALVLGHALMTETLERRLDRVFGISRTEEERDQRLVERLQVMEQQLVLLSEIASEPDIHREDNAQLRYENAILREQVEELGGIPFQLGKEGGNLHE